MSKPASAPDVIPPREKPQAPAGDGEGTNETRPTPDPSADPLPNGEHKYVPSSPYAPRQ